MKPKNNPDAGAASASITDFIEGLGDWRGKTLARVRKLIHEADPKIVEEWKWVRPKSPGTPVWSHDGIVCVGGAFKEWVKLTFFRGASLNDPKKLFNNGLKGGTWRAIDIRDRDDHRLELQVDLRDTGSVVAANSVRAHGCPPGYECVWHIILSGARFDCTSPVPHRAT